jgi:DNA mismatch repair protein MutL
MESIQILSNDVIDQIAAGEVVERPAHLIKELIENSLDAGASYVHIDFHLGGQKVKVTDDGKGIVKDEMPLAFARHATSKIRKSDDLWQLGTFGFRGEALASLAAVSKIKLTSRTEGALDAFIIEGEFGKFSPVQKSGGNKGTTIWVDELFSNVPARKKFLKSDAAENTQIKNVIKALAMANFQVEFKVLLGGKLEYFWPRALSQLDRLKAILQTEDLFEGSNTFNGEETKVFLSAPHQTSKTRKNIWLFAQNRWIQDRSLQAAILDGYRGLLMHHEYPTAVVFITTPKDEIDVNVHPTKSQVKFKDNSVVFRSVHRAVKSVLQETPWLKNLLNLGSNEFKNSEIKKTTQLVDPNINLTFSAPELTSTQWQQKASFQFEPNESPSVEQKTFLNSDLVSNSYLSDRIKNEAIDYQPRNIRTLSWTNLQVIGQAAQTYVVTQSQNSMILIDQHAAHERVAYETILENWEKGHIDIQNLLIPIHMRMEEEIVEGIMKNKDDLLSLGLDVEQQGPEDILINSIPSLVSEKSVIKSLEHLGQEIVEKGESFAFVKVLESMASTMACHSVVRAGQPLSVPEMKALLESMDRFKFSSFCPHGRPVFVEIPFLKIEKDFGRIV